MNVIVTIILWVLLWGLAFVGLFLALEKKYRIIGILILIFTSWAGTLLVHYSGIDENLLTAIVIIGVMAIGGIYVCIRHLKNKHKK